MPEAPTLARKRAALADFKAEGDAGQFRATIATLNVIDKDQDVTLPGAFQAGQEVKIAAWGHDWDALPIGMGTIGTDDQTAWVEGQFFLDTIAGGETYRTLKHLGARCQWSYGYYVKDYSFGEFEGQSVRFLRSLDVIEASPVMIGAGLGTRTDAIKGATLTLEAHSSAVLATVEEFAARVKALAALRAKEGRTMSGANLERMRAHRDALQAVCTDMSAMIAEHDTPKAASAAEIARLFTEVATVEALLAGVRL